MGREFAEHRARQALQAREARNAQQAPTPVVAHPTSQADQLDELLHDQDMDEVGTEFPTLLADDGLPATGPARKDQRSGATPLAGSAYLDLIDL